MTDDFSLQALDRMYDAQGRWEELADILKRRLDCTYDEAEILALNARLARLYEEQIGDLDHAISTYQDMLDIQPENVAALDRLIHIFHQIQDWDPLYTVLEQRVEIEFLDDARRRQLVDVDRVEGVGVA